MVFMIKNAKTKRMTAFFLSVLLTLFSFAAAPGQRASAAAVTADSAAQNAAAYLSSAVKKPEYGQAGGEWLVLGIVRGGYTLSQTARESYLSSLSAALKAGNGSLSARRYTEYSRTVLALTALGENPRAYAGYDLLKPLTSLKDVSKQGVNGTAYALLAMDAGGFAFPANTSSRQDYIDALVAAQRRDGGWSLNTTTALPDADITAMVLQALSPYTAQKSVSDAVKSGVAALGKLASKTGTFSSYGVENAESCAQVLTALSVLPQSFRTAKGAPSVSAVLSGLLSFRNSDGGFAHTAGGETDLMSTEQALCALSAYIRMRDGKTAFYTMTDVVRKNGAHPDVSKRSVTNRGVTFPDIARSTAKTAVEALAARDILHGCDDGKFHPEQELTRAQFAQILTNALGLSAEAVVSFTDVPQKAWYAPAVRTASRVGLILGAGDGTFSPDRTITREEAAVILVRAAALAGVDTAMKSSDVTSVLSMWKDGSSVSSWARDALAFCCNRGMLQPQKNAVAPAVHMTRGETAQAVYVLLRTAGLL